MFAGRACAAAGRLELDDDVVLDEVAAFAIAPPATAADTMAAAVTSPDLMFRIGPPDGLDFRDRAIVRSACERSTRTASEDRLNPNTWRN